MRKITLRFEARTSDDGRFCDLGCPGLECDDGFGRCRRAGSLEDASAEVDSDFLWLRCPECLAAEEKEVTT